MNVFSNFSLQLKFFYLHGKTSLRGVCIVLLYNLHVEMRKKLKNGIWCEPSIIVADCSIGNLLTNSKQGKHNEDRTAVRVCVHRSVFFLLQKQQLISFFSVVVEGIATFLKCWLVYPGAEHTFYTQCWSLAVF